MATGGRNGGAKKPFDLTQAEIRLRQAEEDGDRNTERLNGHDDRIGAVEENVGQVREGLEGVRKGHRALTELVGTLRQSIDRREKKDEEKPAPVVCWLTADEAAAAEARDELMQWLLDVYLVFVTQGAEKQPPLTDCWLRHPSVVERLMVLRDGWLAAYADGAPATLRLDWLYRHLPPTREAIAAELKQCGLAKHVHENLADFKRRGLPGIDDHDQVTGWWASTRGLQQEPAPAPDALREAAARKTAELHDDYS